MRYIAADWGCLEGMIDGAFHFMRSSCTQTKGLPQTFFQQDACNHISTRAYLHPYMNLHTHTHPHALALMHTKTKTCSHILKHMHVYIQAFVHLYKVHSYTCSCIFVHIRVYTFSFINTYALVHFFLYLFPSLLSPFLFSFIPSNLVPPHPMNKR